MRRLVARSSVVFALAFLFGTPWPSAAQQQFRASISMSGGALDEPLSGTMYFGGNRLRVELAGAEPMTIIAEPTTGRMIFLMESERRYMEMPAGMAPVDATGVRAMDPANPCGSGEVTRCQRIGEERVNGYATVHWSFERDGEPEEAWIAPQFRFPVRLVDAEGTTTEWSDFQTGTQPAALFEVPAGYTAMSMPGFGGGFGGGRGFPAGGAGAGAIPPGVIAGLPPGALDGLDSATLAMIQGISGGAGLPGGGGGGGGGAPSGAASAWEAVEGWVAEITVEASGSSDESFPGTQTRRTREFSLSYRGNVPFTYGTPAVMGVGPAWQLIPGLGTPASLAQAITFTGQIRYREVSTIAMQCPITNGERRTTVGTGSAQYSELPHDGNGFAMGLQARLELSGDLRTYKFGAGVGAPEGTYQYQEDLAVTEVCPQGSPRTDSTTGTRQPGFVATVQAEGLPLPSAPGPLTGRTTMPIRLDFGGTTETVDATVSWTIRPIR